MATRKPRITRTRQETAAEFETVRNTAESQPEISTQTAEQNRTRIDNLRNLTAGVTPETALKKLTETNLSVNKAMASISETVQMEVTELANLREAKLAEQKELEELHGKEVVASSIKDLIESYNETQSDLVKKHAIELESYEKERNERDARWIKEENDRQAQRKRELDEYNYTTQQVRAKATDEFNAQVLASTRQESIRKEEFERVLVQRENEMKAKEAQFLDFQKQVTEFPDKLKAAEKAEFAKGFNTAQKEAKQEAALAQKDFDAYKTVAENERKSLLQTIDQQNVSLATLRNELTAAYEKVQKISEKALESASGQQTLAQMQQFQQQNQPRNGNNKT